MGRTVRACWSGWFDIMPPHFLKGLDLQAAHVGASGYTRNRGDEGEQGPGP